VCVCVCVCVLESSALDAPASSGDAAAPSAPGSSKSAGAGRKLSAHERRLLRKAKKCGVVASAPAAADGAGPSAGGIGALLEAIKAQRAAVAKGATAAAGEVDAAGEGGEEEAEEHEDSRAQPVQVGRTVTAGRMRGKTPSPRSGSASEKGAWKKADMRHTWVHMWPNGGRREGCLWLSPTMNVCTAPLFVPLFRPF